MLTQEQLDAFAKAEEEATCKHCGRCVLLGPPCCYQKLYDMYMATVKERDWLRKVQSKKDKKIQSLLKEIEVLQKDVDLHEV